jgi:hypothetical protein
LARAENYRVEAEAHVAPHAANFPGYEPVLAPGTAWRCTSDLKLEPTIAAAAEPPATKTAENFAADPLFTCANRFAQLEPGPCGG